METFYDNCNDSELRTLATRFRFPQRRRLNSVGLADCAKHSLLPSAGSARGSGSSACGARSSCSTESSRGPGRAVSAGRRTAASTLLSSELRRES